MILLPEGWCIYDSWDWGLGLYPIQSNYTGENPIAILSLSANHNDTLDNRGICEGEAARVLAWFLGDGAEEVNEMCNSNRISTDAHVNHGTWSALINAHKKHFMTNNVYLEAHNVLTEAFGRPHKEKLKLDTRRSKARKHCSEIFSGIKNINFYVRLLKPYFCKMKLEELGRTSSNRTDARRIIAAKERSQRVLMEHEQPWQAMNSKIRKKKLRTLMFKDT